MLRQFCIITLLLAALCPTEAWAEEAAASGESAESDPLQRARELLEQAEYRRSQREVLRVIEEGGLARIQLAEAYGTLAECSVAMRRRKAARDAFVRMLAVRPSFELSDAASPLLKAPFNAAREFWESNTIPSITYVPPNDGRLEPGESLEIVPEAVRGPLPDFASELTLHVQRDDGSWEVRQNEEGRFQITADELEARGEEPIRFFVAIRDGQGSIVTSAGSPTEPLEVSVIIPEPPAPPPVEEPVIDETPRRPWYRQWWVWTIVGSVAVGLAVGLPVGLSRDAGDDLCMENLNSSCDHQLNFRP